MRTSKKWLCTLAAALGCVMPVQSFGFEFLADEAPVQQPVTPTLVQQSATPTLVQQTAATNSYWAEQPAAIPQPAPAPSAMQAPGGPTYTPLPAYSGSNGCCPLSLVAMVEATFFWPQFNRDFLRTSFTNGLGTQQVSSNAALGSTDGSLLVGPRITLGVQGECWGIVGRYWNVNSWATGFNPALPSSSQIGVTSFDGFSAYTADLQVQRRFCWCDWNMYGFGGVRYASVNNDRNLNVQNNFGGIDTVSSSSFASQQFNGTGITFGMWGWRPLFDCSPFSLYFSNRYSVLWGNGKTASQNTSSVTDPINGFATSTNGAAASATGDLFIAEVQLGLMWSAQLQCLPGRAFVRSGIEYQYWDSNFGATSGSNSFATLGGVSSSASSNASDFLFSLIGFNIGAGIIF